MKNKYVFAALVVAAATVLIGYGIKKPDSIPGKLLNAAA